MKKFCYSIIGLFVIVLVSSCSNGSKVLQSPEDAVRERYGCRGKQKKNMKPLASLTESSKGLHPLQSFKNGRNIIMKKMPYSKKKSNSTT